MAAYHWFSEHWFDLLQTVGIIGSLLIGAYAMWRDEQARKIANAIAINDQYRRVWQGIYDHPALARVLEKDADLIEQPTSIGEEMFVTTLIAHLNTVFRAMQSGEFVKLEGLRKDVQGFLKLPIPRFVWEKIKPLQEDKFVAFVEYCLKEK